MKKKYRIYIVEHKSSTVPDGWYLTNYAEYAFTQKGYCHDYDTIDEAEEALISESIYKHSFKEYTIQPIYVNEKDSN
jgi:hypothetical protein